MNMKSLLTAFLIFNSLYLFAQRDIMLTNNRKIDIYDGNFLRINSIIDTGDYLQEFEFYEKSGNPKKIRIVSKIDSLEFNCIPNKEQFFNIVYNKDTLNFCINYTDKIVNKLSKSDKIFALSSFWSEVKYNFAFFDELNFDWDSLYKAYIPIIEKTENDYEFFKNMDFFSRSLNDGHTGIHYPEYDKYKTIQLALELKYFNDTMYVCSASKLINDIMPIGSKIIEINGIEVGKFMKDNIYPFVESKIKTTIQLLAPSLLLSSSYKPDILTFRFLTPLGKINDISLNKETGYIESEYIGYKRKRTPDALEIKWEKNNIAILELNSFNEYDGRLIEYFEKIKDTLYKADGLIIDLRKNLGGSTLISYYFLKHILKSPYFLTFGYQTRINNGVKKANGNYIQTNKDFYEMKAYQTVSPDTIYIEDKFRPFPCPIIILTSSMTCSAAEDFLIMLYELENRPLIIGSPTFGSSGSPLLIDNWIDKSGFARICTKRLIYPYSHNPFKTIIPDIILSETYNDFLQDKDIVKERAVIEMKKLVKK